MAVAATASSNASAANEAAESTRQLATGIGEIDPTARSLRDQAEALRTLVARFHIEPEELGATRSPVTSDSRTSS